MAAWPQKLHAPQGISHPRLTGNDGDMAIYAGTPPSSSRAKGKQHVRSDLAWPQEATTRPHSEAMQSFNEPHHHSSSDHTAYVGRQTALDSSYFKSSHETPRKQNLSADSGAGRAGANLSGILSQPYMVD